MTKKIVLTEEQKMEMVRLSNEGMIGSEIAERFNIGQTTVFRIFDKIGHQHFKSCVIGDVVHGWRIDDIYLTSRKNGRSFNMVKLTSIFDEKIKRSSSLSHMNKKCVPWSDGRRNEDYRIPQRDRLRSCWTSAKSRCRSIKNSAYSIYGGRGIKFDERWDNFNIFKEWALENGYNNNLTLDRIDPNGNYCPENCRWATYLEQGRNRRNSIKYELDITAWGETKSIHDWVIDNRCRVPARGLFHRMKIGWEPEKAISLPSSKKKISFIEWGRINIPEHYQTWKNL